MKTSKDFTIACYTSTMTNETCIFITKGIKEYLEHFSKQIEMLVGFTEKDNDFNIMATIDFLQDKGIYWISNDMFDSIEDYDFDIKFITIDKYNNVCLIDKDNTTHIIITIIDKKNRF